MSLYYPTNVYQLSSNQKRVLDSILYVGWVRDGDSLIIQGYADHQGQADHNFHLSLRRAESIKDHLLSRGWVGHRLRLEGKGELEASDETQTGIPEHRRIDMIVWRDTSFPPTDKTSLSRKNAAKIPSPYQEWLAGEKGKPMALENLLFYPGLRRVLPSSIPVLDTLYQFLEAHPQLRIRLEGHVCCVLGSGDAIDEETMELALSLNRAEFIYQYLVHRGIEASRIEYTGFGHRRPKVPIEKSDEDRQANRRVEIRLID